MSDRATVFEKVKEYLTRYLKTTLKPNHEITEQTLLYHDLGLRGTDAYEFMQFIMSEFDVDLADFYFKTYFHDEYFGIRDIFRAIFKIYDRSRKPISVGHIVDVCLAKKWTSPE